MSEVYYTDGVFAEVHRKFGGWLYVWRYYLATGAQVTYYEKPI